MDLSPVRLLFLLSLFAAPLSFAQTRPASDSIPAAINALGLELYRAEIHDSPEGNLLLSPYSIQNALAMTYAGAEGKTRTEMQHVLHFPIDQEEVDAGFSKLANGLTAAAEASKKSVAELKRSRRTSVPMEITVANRLFGQSAVAFRAAFLETLQSRYGAPLAKVDFAKAPEEARVKINDWVADQTKQKIRDIVPPGGVDASTRLALVNAVYLRAGWSKAFSEMPTGPRPFLVHGGRKAEVPTMFQKNTFGYRKRRRVFCRWATLCRRRSAVPHHSSRRCNGVNGRGKRNHA